MQVGLGYADTLPLRMCPGGMMSLVYASLVLAVFGAPLPQSRNIWQEETMSTGQPDAVCGRG